MSDETREPVRMGEGDDSEDPEEPEPERFVSIESAGGQVTVRDDSASIEEMQEAAKSLHSEAVSATLEVNGDEESRGWQ